MTLMSVLEEEFTPVATSLQDLYRLYAVFLCPEVSILENETVCSNIFSSPTIYKIREANVSSKQMIYKHSSIGWKTQGGDEFAKNNSFTLSYNKSFLHFFECTNAGLELSKYQR